MRSGWMSWVRTAAAGLALAAGVWAQGAGAAEVKNVMASFLWPWGRVGISYEVVGKLPESTPLVVRATDWGNSATYFASAEALSGDTGMEEGTHRIVWDMVKQGINIQSSEVTFTVTDTYHPLYCVVDLSAGSGATKYPVKYLDQPPSGGFNTVAYTTTKLVLRRIDPGRFNMGSPADESGRYSNETQHQVTLTHAYYIGLHEVTQRQYELVMGSNPSYCTDKGQRPVEQVTWNMIRGNTNWPASSVVSTSSFMGRLRARTGLAFDLPTEAQWEYACRAGTTTPFFFTASQRSWYMCYGYAYGEHPIAVGGVSPNPWGLYDITGMCGSGAWTAMRRIWGQRP